MNRETRTAKFEVCRGTGVPPVESWWPIVQSAARSSAFRRNLKTFRLKAGLPARRSRAARDEGGFTLIEILLALALIALVLVAVNTFVFSMGELWGRNSDVRLFDRHTRAVTRFIERELRAAVLPPAATADAAPLGMEEIRPQNGTMENLLTFDLPSGSRFFTWPERPLPEVVCSFQVRPGEGLVLLWHSRLEKNFETDPPRESVITPMVTALAYDYYDSETKRWTTERMLKMDAQNEPQTPQRLRFTFTYGKLTRETVVALPSPSRALPVF